MTVVVATQDELEEGMSVGHGVAMNGGGEEQVAKMGEGV